MALDLQPALSSLLQKYDILSNEIAQLKIKLDTSISLSKYSDLYQKEKVMKSLAVNETKHIRTS
jgi:uncharacterized protein YlxP (DUF503 family)